MASDRAADPDRRLARDSFSPYFRPSCSPSPVPPTLEPALPRKGRGAQENPTGRFERFTLEADLEALAEASRADDAGTDADALPRTRFLPDPARTALTFNQSPDIPFDASLNPYRGCEHGCAYCYARPTHEYLGYSAGLDFETKILVKERAPELLRRELAASRWVPQVVALSGVTDAYQPVERRLRLTRRCVEVFAEFRNPIAVITKNALVTRDVDLFQALASVGAVSVSLSIGSLDPEIQRTLEPRASSIRERLRAVETLARAGIPTGVILGPVIPGLTDHEMPAILEAAKNAGASHAGYIVLRLPFGLKTLFDDWLRTHQPLRRNKVLHRLESLRDGRLNDPRFGTRMRGEGHFADQIGATFRIWARKHGLDSPRPALSTAAFRRPAGPQLELGF
ncbi:MAG: PA0069 family radical SAM protein [Deltaproteobacteria bacterium]|nr:PA0069 family radical SAM protein [Deltaproteobacteria bacterium]